MPTIGWQDKAWVLHIHGRIVLYLKGDWKDLIWENLHGSRNHYVKQNRQVTLSYVGIFNVALTQTTAQESIRIAILRYENLCLAVMGLLLHNNYVCYTFFLSMTILWSWQYWQWVKTLREDFVKCHSEATATASSNSE